MGSEAGSEGVVAGNLADGVLDRCRSVLVANGEERGDDQLPALA